VSATEFKTKCQIRWLIRRDMPDVLAIDFDQFNHPWWEEDYLSCLRQRNAIGMVAECGHDILGAMIYELHKSRLRILRFVVKQSHERQGVGAQMIRRLVDKLSQQRRREILVNVPESLFDAQLFFKAMGFEAIKVLREEYDNGEDAYVFRYTLRESLT